MLERIEDINDLTTNAIYRCEGFVKDRSRLFQFAGLQEQEGVKALVFFPCVGGQGFPLNPEALQEAIGKGDVALYLEETL